MTVFLIDETFTEIHCEALENSSSGCWIYWVIEQTDHWGGLRLIFFVEFRVTR